MDNNGIKTLFGIAAFMAFLLVTGLGSVYFDCLVTLIEWATCIFAAFATAIFYAKSIQRGFAQTTFNEAS